MTLQIGKPGLVTTTRAVTPTIVRPHAAPTRSKTNLIVTSATQSTRSQQQAGEDREEEEEETHRSIHIALSTRRTALAAFAAPLIPAAAASASSSSSAAATATTATTGATATGAAAATTRRLSLAPLLSVSGDYDRYAESYERLDAGAVPEALGFDALRRELAAEAFGDVLEPAAGTGLNLPLYDAAKVRSVTLADISPGMLREAGPRADALARRIEQSSRGGAGASGGSGGSASTEATPSAATASAVRLLTADASALPFPDASFDCCLDTFSLCVFERPAAAVKELARVLRPGGRLLLLEHARSDNALLAAYQDATNAAVRPMSKGCAWNQDVAGMVRGAGLRIVRESRSVAGTITLIVAERAAA